MTKNTIFFNVNNELDRHERKKLSLEGIELAEKICNNFCFKYRIKDREELYSYLLEKLAIILNKFDKGRNIPFRFFASKSFTGYAYNFIRDHGRTIKIPRKYSELYLKFNALKKKRNGKLSVDEAAEILEVEKKFLREAIEASSLRFSEITDYGEYSGECLISTAESAAHLFIKNLNLYHREILEEIYVDGKSPNKVFLNKGLTPSQGERLVKKLIEEIYELSDDNY